MSIERILDRYLTAAAPMVILPGRNRSVEYNNVPGQVAAYLEKSPVVYIQDEAGFIEAKQLAQDVVQKVALRLMLDSRKAEQGENSPLAAALVQVAKEAEKHLDVMVTSVTSPKSGKKGWKVMTRPEIGALRQKAEYMARGEG